MKKSSKNEGTKIKSLQVLKSFDCFFISEDIIVDRNFLVLD